MKIVIAHPFQQHSYKTAIAIKNAGYSFVYITTIYNKRGTFTYHVSKILSGDDKLRATKRFDHRLENREVVVKNEILSLLLLLVQRISSIRFLYNYLFNTVIDHFNRSLYRYIIDNDVEAIIVYDTVSAGVIKKIKENNLDVKIILDMSAPYHIYMLEKFNADFLRHPEISSVMCENFNNSINKEKIKSCVYEILHADAFLVASTVTENSLVWAGIPEKKIYKCRYGIDDFPKKENVSVCVETIHKRKLNVLYVGRINQEKGAYQLLRIAEKLSPENFEFHFYGSLERSGSISEKYGHKYNFYGHVPRSKMAEVYRQADVLIFPTLCDGFGFVTVEALSNGVPVLISSDAGSCDLITDGKNGYIFSVEDDNYLMNLLLKIENNRELLRQMRNSTVESVSKLTWDRYNDEIKIAMKQILS